VNGSRPVAADQEVPGTFTFADVAALRRELDAMTERMDSAPLQHPAAFWRLVHWLAGLLTGGQVLRPGMPHPYAELREWPGTCWCEKRRGGNAPAHLRARGGAR
jgi:hypothetical protein